MADHLPTLGEVAHMGDPDVENQGFEIRDISAAEWAAEKVLAANSEMSRIEEHAKMLKAQVDQWKAEEIKKAEKSAEHLKSLLRQWAEDNLGDGTKVVSLPGAKLRFRALPEKVVVDDEEAMLAWFDEHRPDLVKVKKSVDKRDIKSLIGDDGIPGVRLEGGYERFYVDEG